MCNTLQQKYVTLHSYMYLSSLFTFKKKSFTCYTHLNEGFFSLPWKNLLFLLTSVTYLFLLILFYHLPTFPHEKCQSPV